MQRKKILIIAGGIAVVLIILLAVGLRKDLNPEPASLEVWAVYDSREAWGEFIDSYQKENKHISIDFKVKSFNNYEEELIDAFAAGEGPDIFYFHNTWLPKHKSKLNPMPQSEEFITARDFENTFMDTAHVDFVDESKIYALPLYIDTLALYYNKNLLSTAGISSPPTTWSKFIEDVEALTKRDQWGNITQSGAAIGTAENINRSTDILFLLMLQTGTKMTDDNNNKAVFNQASYLEKESFSPGKEALRFYTDFANPNKRAYCWNRQMSYSIDAFYQGKAAMMINYSHHIQTIKDKASYFDFDVASIPQIADREFDVNYPNYWGLAVSKTSKHSLAAWKLISVFTQQQNLQNYLEKAQRPTSRRDLVEWQAKDPYLGIFARQALTARSWYQADSQAIEQIFASMVQSVVVGETKIEQAINKAADQVSALMK